MDIHSKPYLHYKNRIYPRIKGRRGATNLLLKLENIAFLGLEKISEESQEGIEGDWKNLIILDECRHDTYEEVNGNTDYRYSKGGSTKQYIKENFSDGEWDDIVYITGNPHFYPDLFENIAGRSIEEVFFEVFNTYDTDWDCEKGVVLPGSIKKDALTAEKLFPEKRKIIHFMQPHIPFLTSDFSQEPNTLDIKKKKGFVSETVRAENGEIEGSLVRKHYKENLEYVMPYAKSLLEKLDGKTVVTSDHGVLLGENGIYTKAHGSNRRIKNIRKVPWDVNE